MRRSILPLIIAIGMCAAVTSSVRACACCLSVGGIHSRADIPLATFLDRHHRAAALETMTFQGRMVWQPQAGSPDDEPETMTASESPPGKPTAHHGV